MILLDTNVISEPLRKIPDPRVSAWLDLQRSDMLYLSSITVAEVRLGIANLPVGRHRTSLHNGFELMLLPKFLGRVIAFDLPASEAYANLMSLAKRQGRAISKADGYIAGIAAARGFSVATRDRSPFLSAGLTVIDPWSV